METTILKYFFVSAGVGHTTWSNSFIDSLRNDISTRYKIGYEKTYGRDYMKKCTLVKRDIENCPYYFFSSPQNVVHRIFIIFLNMLANSSFCINTPKILPSCWEMMTSLFHDTFISQNMGSILFGIFKVILIFLLSKLFSGWAISSQFMRL